jgi:hypothetical protein
MNQLLRVCLVVLLTATSGLAASALPKWVYKIDKLDEARAEAEKEHKGLAFVMTDPGST